MRLNENTLSLFSNAGKTSQFSGIDLSQYALIKSGSYKKVLKSYLAENKEDVKKSSSTKAKEQDKTSDTVYTSLKNKADALSDNLTKLNKDSIYEDATKDEGRTTLNNLVKDFVSSYNDVLTKSNSVNSTEVKNNRSYMNSMTSTMSNSLSKLGISTSTNGKLTLDEDKLKSASIKDIKNLFNGDVTYASQIKGYADSIAKAAATSTTLYNKNGAAVSTIGSLFEGLV